MSKFGALGLEVEKPGRMVIVHPVTRQPLRDKDKKQAYVDVYSNDSALARLHRKKALARRLDVRGRGKQTPEDLEAERLELLAVLTADWYLVGLNGEPIDVACTTENALELYADPEVAWLWEQVDEYAVDRSNFLKASSLNSAPGRK